MSIISTGTTSTTGYTVSSDTTGALVIKTGSSELTAVTFDASQNMVLASTGGMGLPQGTTAQRPGTPTNGMTRVNTTTNAIESYSTSGNTWITIGSLNSTPSTVEYLVVAGGGSGGGGAYNGGGGGGGGLLTGSLTTIVPNTLYSVTVGAGGAASTASGNNGNASTFSTISTIGGGGGGEHPGSNINGKNGGSGGGGSQGGSTRGLGTPGQGNDGGGAVYAAGSGGGGAGAAVPLGDGGTPAVIQPYINGGAGLASSISGISTYYAGGGGGGARGAYGVPQGIGGVGGGGSGGTDSVYPGISGTDNTGGGGGGGGSNAATIKASGAGGSGIIIIRYPSTYAAATATTGSPVITNANGYRTYQWNTSGSITF